MLHERRRWCVVERLSVEVLASELTEQSWCLCNGFRIGECVFLNDSTSEDGAQEFALVKVQPDGGYVQHESITVGWVKAERAATVITEALAGKYDEQVLATGLALQVETPEVHERCALCA